MTILKTSKLFTLPPTTAAILGGLTIATCGQLIHRVIYAEQKWLTTSMIVLGLGIFALAAAWEKQVRWLEKPNTWAARLQERTGQTPTQLIYLVLGLVFAFISALAAGINGINALIPWLSIVSWVLGIVLLVLGSWDTQEAFPRLSRQTILIAVGLFVISTILRAWNSTTVPPVLNGDEASAGLSAVSFIEGHANNIFGIGWFSFPSFYYLIQSFSIRLLGQTTFALRFTSALIGGLTVSAVYLIGKRLFDQKAGLLAAVFLAGSHFHNHFSRIGLNNIWDAFWFLLALGFLVDGWRNKRRSSFIFSGLSIGLAQYFYVSSRFLVILVIVWLTAVVLFDKKRIPGNQFNVLVLALLFLAVVLPSAWFFSHDEDFRNFLAPFNRVEALGDWLKYEVEIREQPAWKIVKEMIWTSLKTFVSAPTQVWYPADVPIMRPTSAVLFLAGLILLLFQIKQPITWMLFFWLGIFALAGGLSVPASSAQRYVAVIPACALVIGSSMSEIIDLITKARQERVRILTLAAAILLVGLGVSDLYYYFKVYTPNTELGGANTLVAQRLAETLKDEEPLDVAFFGGSRMNYYSISSIPFLAPQINGVNFYAPWGTEESPELTADTIIFVFLPDQESNLELVRQDFPDGELVVEFDRHDNILYWLYRTENIP